MLKRITALIIIVMFIFCAGITNCFAEVLLRIQVGAFEQRDNAEEQVQQLKKHGFDSYISSQKFHTVYVGDFNSNSEANDMSSKLSKLGYATYIVENTEGKAVLSTMAVSPDSNALTEPVNSDYESKNIFTDPDIDTKDKDDANLEDAESEAGENITDNSENDAFKSKKVNIVSNDVPITGVYGGISFFVNKHEYWNMNDNSYLELYFDQVEVPGLTDSTLTVYINNVSIRSIKLANRNREDLVLNVGIPSERLQNGYNQLSIRLSNKVEDRASNNKDKMTNWLVIKKKSYMYIEYKLKEDGPEIAGFPYPYVIDGEDDIENCSIVIPDGPSKEEVKGAVAMSALLSMKSPSSSSYFPILYYSDLNDESKAGNLIFIAQNKSAFPDMWENVEGTNQQIGYIDEMSSPFNGKYKALMVSGDIQKALKSLSNDDLVTQMRKPQQTINYDIIGERQLKTSGSQGIITFEELDYQDALLEGAYNKKAQYNLLVPNYWSLKNLNYMNLKFEYSEVLNFEKSTIEVYINQEKAAGKNLSLDYAGSDEIRVEIPEKCRGNKTLSIEIELNLEKDDIGSSPERGEEAWANILKSSYLEFEYKNSNAMVFEKYPFPMVEGEKVNKLAFVIDKLDNIDQINICGRILSQLVKGSKAFPDFDMDKDIKREFKDSNIILIASPDQGNNIKKYNHLLYLNYDEGYNNFIYDSKIAPSRNSNKMVASIQLLKSFFNNDRVLMVITAPKWELLKIAPAILSTSYSSEKLLGNVIIADSQEIIGFGYYGDAESMQKNEKEIIIEDRKKENIFSAKNLIIASGGFLVLLLAGGIYMYLKNF